MPGENINAVAKKYGYNGEAPKPKSTLRQFAAQRQQAETIDGQYFEGMKKPSEGYENFDDIDTDGSGDLSFEEIMDRRSTELANLRLQYYVVNPLMGIGEFIGTRSLKLTKERSTELSHKIDHYKEQSEKLWEDYNAGKKPAMYRIQPGEVQTLPKPKKINGETLKINTKV